MGRNGTGRNEASAPNRVVELLKGWTHPGAVLNLLDDRVGDRLWLVIKLT